MSGMNNPMRVYIATKLENTEAHNRVRDELAVDGWHLTYDWTTHGPVWREGHKRMGEVAVAELKGVRDAAVVVVLLPGGRGTHAELGMALAFGKPVVLAVTAPGQYEAENACAFYYHPSVRIAPAHEGTTGIARACWEVLPR